MSGTLLRLDSRRYAAARDPRASAGWSPVGDDINALLRSSAQTIRNRSRQLVRDFAYFASAVQTLVDYTVGSGVRCQCRIRRKNGSFNTPLITQIENAWQRWMEEADLGGRLHYHEIEQLCKRQDVEAGEFIIVKAQAPDRSRFLPFALQVYESEWLTSVNAYPINGNWVDQGVEFDTATGAPVAYHFAVPDGYGLTGTVRTQRVEAQHVIHGYETKRPGQLRGISPFTTAILVANDLHDYMGAEIDGAKNAAKWLAFVETPDVEQFQALRTSLDKEGKRVEELDSAIIEYLQPGEKINLASHNRPGDSFDPFTRFVLRMVAVATGTTYELLTGDYQGINYSNLRGIRNDFAARMRPLQQRHVRQFCQPVYAAFLESLVQSGRITLPGFWEDPWQYTSQVVWQPPGMESIDPLREGKAWIEQINAGLRSPQEITAARGRDYEEVLAEIAEARRLCAEKGVPWLPNGKAPLANNPAAVEPATSGA